MNKKILLALMFLAVTTFLAGCFNINDPVTDEAGNRVADTDGIWATYFVYPLSWLMVTIAEGLNHSYGLAIIVVTIILRIAILPLMIKQTKSTKAMQELQPEMQKLREKYSAKDQKSQQKLQEETMKLFQEHGVNPLAGCFPILIQMPILIAFYHAIMRTESVNDQTFLWFQLGEPDFILPLIAGITTFIQQKMMMVNNTNPQMQILLYMMPIMITVFAFFFPSALALYWVIGNLFMIVQTYFITGPSKNNQQEASTGGAKK
ncbi:protein translocase subunit yidC [Salsuginibacillus halophilus]|uniref:Membrane protein insertase YidC n=1 Tax=Salsuginibacillus halophilus TaxID=517424 RepID=A0A2P8HI96_9BACI|nr:YidC family membrane integrase SpoIIIJ [Salsuginibacillus halophilus]PSL45939.1 protein translocase subunit yidC [Salsuginibacillus halophilus]